MTEVVVTRTDSWETGHHSLVGVFSILHVGTIRSRQGRPRPQGEVAVKLGQTGNFCQELG